MRPLVVLALLCSASTAQIVEAPAEVRGIVLDRDPGPTGEFSVRAPNNHVFRYRFDAKTAIDGELRPGDQIELTSDATGEPVRYARTIHVVVAAPIARRQPPARPRPYNAAEERLAFRGDLTFSGVISSLSGSRLVLRTRDAGEQTIMLRQDTRYLSNGELVASVDLKPNMRVFVRASKNIYGDVEAHQVVWGTILEVH